MKFDQAYLKKFSRKIKGLTGNFKNGEPFKVKGLSKITRHPITTYVYNKTANAHFFFRVHVIVTFASTCMEHDLQIESSFLERISTCEALDKVQFKLLSDNYRDVIVEQDVGENVLNNI